MLMWPVLQGLWERPEGPIYPPLQTGAEAVGGRSRLKIYCGVVIHSGQPPSLSLNFDLDCIILNRDSVWSVTKH